MVERRNLLTVLAGTGLAASAGCLAAVSDARNSLSGSDDASTPLFEGWFPTSVGAEKADQIAAMYVDLETVRDLEGTLSDSAVSQLRSAGPEVDWLDRIGAGVENVEESFSLATTPVSVLTGSFDEAAVGDELESMNPEASYEYEDFDVYRGLGRERLFPPSVAVDTTTLLRAVPDSAFDSERSSNDEETGDGESEADDGTEPDDSPAIERLIDTGAGNRDRRQDVDETVATLLERTDSPTYLVLFSYSGGPELYPDDSVGGTVGVSISDDRTTARVRVLYEDETSATEDGIRELVSEDEFSGPVDDLSYEVEGRLATVEASMPTTEFAFFGEKDDQGGIGPSAGLQFDRHDDTVTVTITSIERADEITIRRNHEDVETVEDPEAGDSVTVDVSSGDSITVIGSYEGNEALLLEEEV